METIFDSVNIEIKFKSNFLSRKKRAFGEIISLLTFTFCLLMSLLHWSPHLNLDFSVSYHQLVHSKEWYRLFSASFAHGDLKHLLANSFMLLVLTYFVSSFYGLFYSIVVSFLSGALINWLVVSTYEPQVSLVGASGVIYYLWGFWLILFLLIERHQHILVRLLKVTGVFLILLVPTTYSPSTSYLAHYVGFVIGVINGLIYYLCSRHYLHSFEVFEYRIIEYDVEREIYP